MVKLRKLVRTQFAFFACVVALEREKHVETAAMVTCLLNENKRPVQLYPSADRHSTDSTSPIARETSLREVDARLTPLLLHLTLSRHAMDGLADPTSTVRRRVSQAEHDPRTRIRSSKACSFPWCYWTGDKAVPTKFACLYTLVNRQDKFYSNNNASEVACSRAGLYFVTL